MMKKMKKLSLLNQISTCLILHLLPHLVFEENDCVETSTGPIIGTTIQYQGRNVKAFLGIPFAEPPVGDLRFKKPVPKQRWSEPLQATRPPPACLQSHEPAYPWVDTLPNQSEDCLFLNIWVPPNTCEESKKAVMFWIFSGAFAFGSGRLPVYDGRVLAAEGDVIVVTINYRVNIFGFLSTRTEEAPGNMGFYDMLEAMKWVKRNIGAFGGDPDNFTVFGHSAGGISSGLMCLSPLAKGLFQRAILQSGSPAFPLNVNNDRNTELGQQVSKAVGCATEMDEFKIDPERVITCLRSGRSSVSLKRNAKFAAHIVISKRKFLMEGFNISGITFRHRGYNVSFDYQPNNTLIAVIKSTVLSRKRKDAKLLVETTTQVSKSLIGFSSIIGDEFLPIDPKIQLTTGTFSDVDIMIGYTQDEGSFILAFSDIEHFGAFGGKNSHTNKTTGANSIRKSLKTIPSEELVVQYYLGGLKDDDYVAIREETYHSLGDCLIVCPSVYFAESFARKGLNVYMYYFNHIPSVTPWAAWMGSAHFDEIAFVYGRPLDHPWLYHADEQRLSKSMVTIWSSFARTGFPGISWKKYSRSDPYYQVFNIRNRKSYLEAHQKNCEFFRPLMGYS